MQPSSSTQAAVFDLGQRKQKEYALYRIVTQPVGSSILALLLAALRRGSLDGWREDADNVLSSFLWTVAFMSLIVFVPALMAARKQQRKSA